MTNIKIFKAYIINKVNISMEVVFKDICGEKKKYCEEKSNDDIIPWLQELGLYE